MTEEQKNKLAELNDFKYKTYRMQQLFKDDGALVEILNILVSTIESKQQELSNKTND